MNQLNVRPLVGVILTLAAAMGAGAVTPAISAAQGSTKEVRLRLAASPQRLPERRPTMLVQSLDGSPLTLVVDTSRATPRDVVAGVVAANAFLARFGNYEGNSRAQFRAYPRASDLGERPYAALTEQAALGLDALKRAPERGTAAGRTRSHDAVFRSP